MFKTPSLKTAAIVLTVLGWTALAEAPVIAQRAQPDPVEPSKLAATPPATLPAALPAPSGQPPGAGLDIMQRICTPCHNIDFVTAAPRDRASWSDTVQGMVDRGASATPEEIEEIVTYLAMNFSAKKN